LLGLSCVHLAAHGEPVMEYGQIASLANFPPSKLPLVVTFAQFLEAIDATLKSPFFAEAESLSAAQQKSLTKAWQTRIEEQMENSMNEGSTLSDSTVSAQETLESRHRQRKFLDFEVFNSICWPKMVAADEWKNYRKLYNSNMVP